MMNETYPTYLTPEAEALPRGLYFAMFHGRNDVKESMDEFGFAGPVIGPLRYAHTSYASEVKLCMLGDEDSSLDIPTPFTSTNIAYL